MPWIPQLFSEPVLEQLREKWDQARLDEIPYYDGLMSGEHEALVSMLGSRTSTCRSTASTT
jgi:hypothetical protein